MGHKGIRTVPMRASLLRIGTGRRFGSRSAVRARSAATAARSTPSWQELHEASQLARWSGFLYLPTDACTRQLEQDGLKVLHHARDKYTCWAVVEGTIESHDFAMSSLGSLQGAAAGAAAVDEDRLSPVAATTKDRVNQRFILLRGVQWNAPETVVTDIWRALGAFWPVPFAANLTASKGGHLVCHAGVGDVALDLFPHVAPFLRSTPQTAVTFAGHSLGGSLASLLWALSLLHGHRTPDQISCHSFGSPPVLAHNEGGGGNKVMQLLGSQRSSCRHWVQENDPVPRAMMTADPYFTALFQQSGLRSLLEARTWLSGRGSPVSTSRFLYEHVGETYLIQGGCEVLPVNPGEDDTLMRMTYSESFSQPGRTVSYWLDHHHESYANDLAVASMSKLREALAKVRVAPASRV